MKPIMECMVQATPIDPRQVMKVPGEVWRAADETALAAYLERYWRKGDLVAERAKYFFDAAGDSVWFVFEGKGYSGEALEFLRAQGLLP